MPIHVRSLIPSDYEWSEYAARDDGGTGPWYIGHEDNNQLDNKTLDNLWKEWEAIPFDTDGLDEKDTNEFKEDYTGSGEEMDEFVWWLHQEKGYIQLPSAWGGIWHPENK